MRRTRLLFKIHRWTGLSSAVFVLFFSITGAVAVYRAEIDRWLTPGLAIPVPDGGLPAVSSTEALAAVEGLAKAGSLQAALDAAQAVAPDRAPELLWLPQRPDEAIIVRLAPGVDLFRVFVDPATARVTGTARGEHVANVIRQLHLRFYFFGWQGRVVTGLFGLLLLVSAVTGVLIYAPFMRGVWQAGLRWWQVRGPSTSLRASPSTSLRASSRPQLAWSDWHKLIGVSALAFNIVIGATGAVLGLENLQRFSPALATALHPSPKGTQTLERCLTPLPLDRIVEMAEATVTGMTATLVSFPTARQRFFTVSGDLPGRLRASGSSWVTVEPCSGRVIEHFDARHAAVTASTYLWMEPLHFGDFGGWPLKLFYCLLGMTSGVLAISGIGLAAMKWSHRRGG